MSVERASAFLAKAKEDEALRAKLEKLDGVDAMLAAARNAGFEFTVEELQQVVKAQDASRELTDAELADVAAAGANDSWWDHVKRAWSGKKTEPTTQPTAGIQG